MQAPSAIVVGARVHVRADIKEPKFKWGGVKAGSVGVVTQVSGEKCDVDFPEQKGVVGRGKVQEGGGWMDGGIQAFHYYTLVSSWRGNLWVHCPYHPLHHTLPT